LRQALAPCVRVGCSSARAALAILPPDPLASVGAVMPLIDAYALKGLSQRARPIGPVRLWGSVALHRGEPDRRRAAWLSSRTDLIWLIFAGTAALRRHARTRSASARREARRTRAAHSHLRQPAFLAIAAAGSLIQASHAVYYGFSTLDWSAKGFGGVTIGMLWALGVAAEIVLFALAPRLPPAIGPVTLILIGAAGGDRALDRDRVRSAACSAGAAADAACAVVRRDASRHDDVLEPERARRRPRRCAGRRRDRKRCDDGGPPPALAGLLYGAGGSHAYLAMAVLAVAGGAFALLASRLRYPKARKSPDRRDCPR
jgi:PPP family 3-phenylpropionic acid transporter